MTLPGAILEGAAASCNGTEQQYVHRLLAAAVAEAQDCTDHLACASILLKRAESESHYTVLLQSSLARLRAPRGERTSAKGTSCRLPRESRWRYLETLCRVTLGRVPDFVTALEASLENTANTLSVAAMLASATLPQGGTGELLDDLCNQFWKEWVEHQFDSCCPPDPRGSGDPAISWEVWLRCLVLLCGVLTTRKHVAMLLDEGSGGQALHADHWLQLGGNTLRRAAGTLANSAPSILHVSYQQWLVEDSDASNSEGVVAELFGYEFHVLKTCQRLCIAGFVLSEIANCCIYDELVGRALMETVLRLVNHYWKHLLKVCEGVPSRLSPKVWYLIMSSWTLLYETLNHMPLLEGPRVQLMQDLCSSCDTLRDQVTSYHSQLCITTLFQDPAGHNWNNARPFFEGQRCSFAVQMWAYHLKGLHHDLWEVCPPQLAVMILGEVLGCTLLHLEKCYSCVRPSSARLPQFRGDILGILATVASFLPSLKGAVGSFASLHIHCWTLLCSLALVGCTLNLLGSAVVLTVQNSTPLVPTIGEDCYQWRSFIDLSAFGLLCPSEGAKAVSEHMTWLISGPLPQWDLLLDILLNKDGNLASHLCKDHAGNLLSTAIEGMEGSLVYHIATVLSHCYHKPQALCAVLKGKALHNNTAEDSLAVRWLSCYLGPVLKSTIWPLAAKFVGFLKRHQASGLNSVLEEVLTCVERCLFQLPHPVVYFLWDMALASGTDQDHGPALAKVLGRVLTVHMQRSRPPLEDVDQTLFSEVGQFYTTVVTLLDGTLWITGSQEVLALVHRTVMSRALKSFGSTLSLPPPAHPVANPAVEVSSCPKEGEVVAQLLAEDDLVLTSLRFVYQCFKGNEEAIVKVLLDQCPPNAALEIRSTPLEPASERFEPTVAMMSLGRGSFDHSLLLAAEMVDWEALVPEAVYYARNVGTLKSLVGNRPDMQQGADLNEHDAEIVTSIRQSLIT